MFQKLFDAGKLKMPDEDVSRALWDVTQEVTQAAGLPAYEISNHARPGAESRHNLVYWRYGEYAGVGPGAHGRLITNEGRLAQATEKHPETWLEHVERDEHGIIETEVLTPEAQGDEFLLMGLRLKEGIDPTRFEALSGTTLNPRRVADLIEHGMIQQDADGRIRVTQQGFPVLDAIVADLAA
jgi:oxygen-independent coproporphyrinogen-3 oxidase